MPPRDAEATAQAVRRRGDAIAARRALPDRAPPRPRCEVRVPAEARRRMTPGAPRARVAAVARARSGRCARAGEHAAAGRRTGACARCPLSSSSAVTRWSSSGPVALITAHPRTRAAPPRAAISTSMPSISARMTGWRALYRMNCSSPCASCPTPETASSAGRSTSRSARRSTVSASAYTPPSRNDERAPRGRTASRRSARAANASRKPSNAPPCARARTRAPPRRRTSSTRTRG